MEWFNKIRSVQWNFLFQRFSSVLADKFVGIITNILLARLTNPDNFGIIILVYSVSDVVFSVFDFGLSGTASIEFSKNQISKKNLLFTSVKYKLWTIPAVFSISFLVSFFLNQQVDIWIVLLIIFSEGLNSVIQIYLGLYFSNNDFGKLLINTVISRSVQILFYCLVLFFFPNYYLIFAAVLVQYIISLLLCTDYTRKLNLSGNGERTSLLELFKQYKYLGINRVFNSFNSRIDNFLISQLLNLKDLASYGVSMIFYRNFGLLSNSLASIYLPKYGLSFQENNQKEIFNESLAASFIIGIISGLFVFAISDIAVGLLWGNRYSDAVLLIRIFSFGIPFLFIRTTSGYFLNFLGKTKFNLMLSVFSFILSLLLNLFLIPVWGLIASAAISVIIPAVNVFVMLFIINKSLLQENEYNSVLKPNGSGK